MNSLISKKVGFSFFLSDIKSFARFGIKSFACVRVSFLTTSFCSWIKNYCLNVNLYACHSHQLPPHWLPCGKRVEVAAQPHLHDERDERNEFVALTREMVADGLYAGKYSLESDVALSRRRKVESWKQFRQVIGFDSSPTPIKLPFVQCLKCATVLKFGKYGIGSMQYHATKACAGNRDDTLAQQFYADG